MSRPRSLGMTKRMFSLHGDTYKKLEKKAVRLGISISELVRRFVDEGLRREANR